MQKRIPSINKRKTTRTTTTLNSTINQTMSSEQRRAARLRLGLFEVRVEKDFGHASHQKLNGRELASRVPDGASNKGNHRSSHRALPCPFFLSRVWREVLCLRYKMLASVRAHGIAVVAVDLILMPFITTKANSIIISQCERDGSVLFLLFPLFARPQTHSSGKGFGSPK